MPVNPLTDLVEYWNLTSNPNGNANGRNLTPTGATFTYDSEGAHFNGTDQYLSHVDAAYLQANNSGFLITACVTIDSFILSAGVVGKFGDGGGDEWGVLQDEALGAYQEFGLFIQDGDASYPEIGFPQTPASDLDLATRYFIAAWYDPTAKIIYGSLNNGTALTASVFGSNPSTTDGFHIGGAPAFSPANLFNGKVGLVGYWIGANALTIANDAAFMTWLYNSGAGRTYAELAAYGQSSGGSTPPPAPGVGSGSRSQARQGATKVALPRRNPPAAMISDHSRRRPLI